MRNLDNYITVAERLNAAKSDIKTIVSDAPVMMTAAMGYIRVTVTLKSGASATATASFRLDLTVRSAQATNPLEDAETSAVGRALGFLGYSSNRAIATAEDVAEAQARELEMARTKFYEYSQSVTGQYGIDVVREFLSDMTITEPTTVDEYRTLYRRVKAAA